MMKKDLTIWDVIFRRPKLYAVTTKDHADWLDLFYDLLFVGLIAILNTTFVTNFTFNGFLQFMVGFLAIWLIWLRNTFYSARARMNDTYHRFFVLFKMGTMMFIGVAAVKLSTHAYLFVLAYIAARLLQLFIYWFTAQTNAHIKKLVWQMTGFYFVWMILLWATFFLPEIWRYVSWITLLFIELAIPWIMVEEYHHDSSIHTPFLNERFGLFTLLILAELLISALLNIQVHDLNFENFILSFLNLVYVFSVWWIYFDQVSYRRIHQSVGRIYWWTQAHLLLFFFLSMQGIILRLIMLNNTQNSIYNVIFLTLVAGIFFTISLMKQLMTYGSDIPRINVFWKTHYHSLIYWNVSLGFVALLISSITYFIPFHFVLIFAIILLVMSISYAMKLWAQGIIYAKCAEK
ncbi:MAG: low temperature requirement protein A [Culicoidibacterales bacterium]